jgi:hypothetical protein
MRRRLSATDSSTLCLTRGGELSKDISPELKNKSNIPQKMRSLNPVSPKKLGIMTAIKQTIPKITGT